MPDEIPAERKRIKFFIAKVDDAGAVKYYGFTGTDSKLGNLFIWMIMKEDSGSYTYIFGNTEFDKAWDIRATLPYQHAGSFKGFHDRFEVV